MHSVSGFAWNALGHRLIAQIAIDHMTSHAIVVYNEYNHALDEIYKPRSLISAAVWLDTLRYMDISWFSAMHYVDLSFSEDGSKLPATQKINALWAVEKSTNLLLNKYASNFDKGIALRVILHVVGDLHQPLHTVSRVSAALPQGDRGGNLVLLPGNPIANNLHAYWDNGAGLLIEKKHPDQTQTQQRATKIEHQWPCKLLAMDVNPSQWAEESRSIAINMAYQLPINDHYQENAQKISEQRIALAGCRLAALLNNIDEMLNKKPTLRKAHRRTLRLQQKESHVPRIT